MFSELEPEKYQQIVNDFKSKYSDSPGVISIKEDDWFGEDIVVFIYEKDFAVGSLPKDFSEVNVRVVDTEKEIQSWQKISDMCDDLAGEEFNAETASTYANANRMLNLYGKLISDYLKKK